ncbi:MAG: VWA domain-containing protein [Mariniphaga sp.]|nr:VWA domain-containing protein [Mariniphaga sp.]
METKHQVHNLIILDESGSMGSIKKTIIQGFNEIVQTVKGIEQDFPEQEHFISLVTFNGRGQKVLHFADPVSKLEPIDEKRYQPDASTPLYDALGFSFAKMQSVVEKLTDFNVLVTILTDGEENASREYSGQDIKKTIDGLKLNRWTFTYIGADHDVERFATSISITNTMTFQKNEADMKMMFAKERSSREFYSRNIREKKDTTNDFYKDDDPKK